MVLVGIGTLALIGRRVRRDQATPFDRAALAYVGVGECNAERASYFAEPARVLVEAAIVAAVLPRVTPRERLGLVAAPTIAVGFGELLKWLVPRERPNKNRFTPQGGKSFPSTHAACATAFGLACAAVAERHGHGRWGYIAALAFGVWVGVERIRCAAHWPSDAIAGVALGVTAAGAALRGG